MGVRWVILPAAVVVAATTFGWVLAADDFPRAATAAAGIIAGAALGFRVLQCWDHTTVLVHVLGLALIASVLLGSLATSVNAANDAPFNPVTWAVLAHRLACILIAVMWPYWLDRTRAPYRTPLI